MKIETDFLVGEWLVRPQRDCIQSGDRIIRLAPKAMSVLCCLAQADGKTLSRKQIFDAVWPNCEVSDDALTQRIVEIRKAFGDSARESSIIETIPKIGFRLIPPVAPPGSRAAPETDPADRDEGRHPAAGFPWRSIAALVTLLAAAYAYVHFAGPRGLPGQSGDLEPRAAATGSGGAEGRSAVNERSIAVLSFDNHGGETGEFHWADAIHEELLTRLTGIASLTVISHDSVEKFKDTDKSVQQIGQQLGVATVLSGSVQVMGNYLRVHTQLVDSRSGEYLWAESFDRELTARNFFAIQSEIASQVATALRSSLTPEESLRVTEVPTENFEAYRALLRGRVALEEGTLESFERAIGHFNRALQLNPEFPQAHIAICGAYSTVVDTLGVPQKVANEQMEKHARLALNINPNLGHAYKFLAQVQRDRGQAQESEELFRKALELDPGNIHIMHGLGLTLRVLGRPEEAIRYYDRAVELDPLSPIINESRGSLLRDLGRFEEAEQQYRYTMQIAPDFVWPYWGMGTLRWAQGKPGEAATWFEQAARLAPRSDVQRSLLALMYLEMQQDDKARAVLDESFKLDPALADNDAALTEELFRIYHGQDLSGLNDARRTMSRVLHGGFTDLPVRELLAGRYAASIDRYEEQYPNISTLELPINGSNYRAAIYVAFALDRLGERRRALALLDRAEEAIAGIPRLGLHGFWVADAQIQVVRRDFAGSLQRLEEASSAGWRNLWRFYLFHDPILQALREQPGFQQIVHDIQADMVDARQQELASLGTSVPKTR